MKNPLCKLFGHRPAFGYGHVEGAGYFKMVGPEDDGMHTHHFALRCECERCGMEYQVGKVHIPNEYLHSNLKV